MPAEGGAHNYPHDPRDTCPACAAPSPVVRPAPDAERDARRAAYAAGERRRATAALDRFITYAYGRHPLMHLHLDPVTKQLRSDDGTT